MIQLGDKAKDKVSGYSGVVTGITEWMNGCRRFLLSPQAHKKGETPKEGYWVDEQQAQLVKRGVVRTAFAKSKEKKRPGGPTPAPTRNMDPKP